MHSNFPNNFYWNIDKDKKPENALEQSQPTDAKRTQETLRHNFNMSPPPGLSADLDDIDRRVLKEGISLEIEETTADGECYLTKKVPFRDKSGDIIGVLCHSLNITKYKALRAQLAEEIKSLQKALKAYDQLLQNLHMLSPDECVLLQNPNKK